MTNLEFLNKSTDEQIASFFAKVIDCVDCFLYGKGECRPHLGCRENFRRWLNEDADPKELK